MNYTEVYKKIYNQIKKDYISHEEAHRASLKITNTLMDVYFFTTDKDKGVVDVVVETISEILQSRDSN